MPLRFGALTPQGQRVDLQISSATPGQSSQPLWPDRMPSQDLQLAQQSAFRAPLVTFGGFRCTALPFSLGLRPKQAATNVHYRASSAGPSSLRSARETWTSLS